MDMYWYCSVQVKNMSAVYSYISDNGEIAAGAYVVVPFGKQNKECIGEVVACGQYTKETAPFPTERTKHILRMASPEEYADVESSMLHSNDDANVKIDEVDEFIENEDWDEMLEWANQNAESTNQAIIRKVIHCYELGVEQNIPMAALNLGTFYYNGVFLKQDFKEAFRLYQIAADAGELRAICNCGYCYYYGRHQAVDYAQALKYFSLGALLFDDPNCLYKLGDLYAKGYGIDQNLKYAYLLYDRALTRCEEWDAESFCLADVQFRVGKCLLYGQGTGKNVESAQNLLSLALTHFYKRRRTDPFVASLISQTRKLLNEANDILQKECL